MMIWIPFFSVFTQSAAYTRLVYFRILQLLIFRRSRDSSLHRPSCPPLLIQHDLVSDQEGSGALRLLQRGPPRPAPLLALLSSLLRHRHQHGHSQYQLYTHEVADPPNELGCRIPTGVRSVSWLINATLMPPVALLEAATFFSRYAHPIFHSHPQETESF
jgi:hypothetical protein